MGGAERSEGDPLIVTDRGLMSLWPHSRELLTALVSCLYTLQFGMVLGYASPSIPDLQEEAILQTSSDISWFSALPTFGALVAGPLGGVLIDKLGRKKSIMLCGIPYMVGWLLLMIGDQIPSIYAGRVLTGLAMGLASLSVPTYIAEISSNNIRGSLGAVVQITIPSGMCLVYVTGIVINRKEIALIGLIISGIAILFMCFFPESPIWLLRKGKLKHSRHSFIWFRGSRANIDEEISQSSVVDHKEEVQMGSTTTSCCQRKYLIPILLSVFMMVFMLLPGANAIQAYTETIFIQAGITEGMMLNTALIVVGLLAVLGVIPTCFLLDRFGRRTFLIISSVTMTMSLVTLGVAFYFIEVKQNNSLDSLLVAGIALYQFFFGLGWEPVTWVVVSEIFPVRVRGIGMAIATTVNWTLGFLVLKTFPAMAVAMGTYGVFWFYGALAFLGIFFVIFVLPETKGKSLMEIETLFE